MPVRYVLDASAGVDILQRTPEGQALSSVIRAQNDDEPELWTVEHFHVEVAKVIRRDTLAGVLDDNEAIHLVEVLAEWPLTVVSVAPLLVEAWQLRNNLTVHDALYVVATRRLEDATLVSSDTKLPNAPGVDVPVITPDRLPS
ncbi:MAG TPA: type II toxin-antitoxin system VapC family toxin [Acidimicrobiales bacterium]